MEMIHFQKDPKVVNLTSESHMTAKTLKEAKIQCLSDDKACHTRCRGAQELAVQRHYAPLPMRGGATGVP